jgi:hypothetical protein
MSEGNDRSMTSNSEKTTAVRAERQTLKSNSMGFSGTDLEFTAHQNTQLSGHQLL